MSTIDEQIISIEKEIRETPFHKGTEHYVGRLRAKLSKLQAQSQDKQARKKGGGGGYAIKKQGDATVVLVGPPSVGKSTLLNKLTNAESKVAPYAFTTVNVIPGMMKYRDAQIQILDVPGLIKGAEKGRGRGREVLSVARGANLLTIITDIGNEDKLKKISDALEKNGIRINKKPPKVRVLKKLSGGIIFHTNIKQSLDNQTIKDIASELGLKNAEITINEQLTMDRLLDAFSRNRAYIPTIFVINKLDLAKNKPKFDDSNYRILSISAQKGTGLEKLRKMIWDRLGLVRIYLVKVGETPNKNNPIIMLKEDTLKNVAEKIGTEFAEEKKRAKIWGPGSKFPAQEVSLKTKVQEGMQVRFV